MSRSVWTPAHAALVIAITAGAVARAGEPPALASEAPATVEPGAPAPPPPPPPLAPMDAVEKIAVPMPAVPARPADEYRPLLTFERWGWRLQAPVLVAARGEVASPFPVDAAGHEYQAGVAVSPLLRIGLRLETVTPLARKLLILAEYEHDLPTGTWSSETPIAGAGMPNVAPFTTRLRKGWARLSIGPYLHLGGGFMTSHWGMGLLANDGAHGWEPGSARFVDPRGGDIVLRGFLATGPLSRARLVALIAIDKVRDDDVLLAGDSAWQLIASALLGQDRPTQGGFFLVHRRQTAADGRTLHVTVIDLAARVGVELGRLRLGLEAEGALVIGDTTFGASADVPRSDVLQIGGALRASLASSQAGGIVDVAFASGDDNTHDPKANAFHTDPGFGTGILMFRYVQAAQTGRGYGTAADPLLVGAPPAGIERLPTRGGFTNAVMVFPRLWGRPARGLEVYGGVLVAFAPARNVDPFNSDLAGGAPRNALGGVPGSYWGTELDLGVRYRALLRGTQLDVGAEGGVYAPGSALRNAAGAVPAQVFGGRLLLSYRL